MTLIEAMNTHKPFKRPAWDGVLQLYPPGSGPYSGLVGCRYFVLREYGEEMLLTSLDLYPEDIEADDYVIEEVG